jgi:hypothetical protein
MAIRGQSRWPSAGNSLAIYGQFFMAANIWDLSSFPPVFVALAQDKACQQSDGNYCERRLEAEYQPTPGLNE